MELQDMHQQSDGNERIKLEDTKFYLRKRYLVAVLTWFGCFLLYCMRMNLSVISLASWLVVQREFQWSIGYRRLIKALYLLGFVTAPLGAIVVRKFGGAVTFGAAVGLIGLLTCFTPTIMYWHFSVLLIAQVLEGILQGICTCAYIEVLRLWSIPTERGRLIGGAGSGFLLGATFSYPIGSAVAVNLDWRAVFYVTGGSSLIWCLIWFILVKNSPEEDNKITTREKNFIKQSNLPIFKVNHSWCPALKSKSVWAYLNVRFVILWSKMFVDFYLFHMFYDVRHYDVEELTPIASIQYYCDSIGAIGASILTDYLRNNNKRLRVSGVHKLYLSFGPAVAIVLFLVVRFWGNLLFSFISFGIFRLLVAFSSVALSVLPVDMGGQYASVISGFGSMAHGFSEFLYPLFAMLRMFAADWSTFSLLCWSIINWFAAFMFYKFGSGDRQPWAVSPDVRDGDMSNSQALLRCFTFICLP